MSTFVPVFHALSETQATLGHVGPNQKDGGKKISQQRENILIKTKEEKKKSGNKEKLKEIVHMTSSQKVLWKSFPQSLWGTFRSVTSF